MLSQIREQGCAGQGGQHNAAPLLVLRSQCLPDQPASILQRVGLVIKVVDARLRINDGADRGGERFREELALAAEDAVNGGGGSPGAGGDFLEGGLTITLAGEQTNGSSDNCGFKSGRHRAVARADDIIITSSIFITTVNVLCYARGIVD